MSEHSIQQDRRVNDGVDPIEEAMPEMTKRYYEAHTRETVAPERKAAMEGRGVFIPSHWLDILDGDAAAYLAHFTHYEGTQSRTDGFISDSEEDTQKKLGKRFTPKKQGRIRRDLRRLGLAEFKPGWGRVTMVRPNMTLIKAWKHYGDYDEAVYALLEGRQGQDETSSQSGQKVPTQSVQKVPTVATKGRDGHDKTSSLNTKTPETPKTLSQRAHARPEPEREERKEEKNQGKVKRSVAILSDIPSINADARMLTRLVTTLAEKHPRVDPVKVCRSYGDHVAGLPEPVRSHQRLLGKFFETEAESIANEPMNPHGPDAERLKDKPRRADWYVAAHGITFDAADRLVDSGMGHAEIIEAIERKEIA